ncbi:MAG: aminopeptidase P family protein [Gammaproteobacteria bacterium]|nr:MAG: aminopeptidase P family protein [Gammaproteobacteria bacterium]UCH41089.1 MAG: aminopeptidase P family protein [Gammaproteobacteria bacterium]
MSAVQPGRGFTQAEYETRTRNAQRLMREIEIDAMLLTTEAQVRYFSGFLTQFWQSPTRPWFLLVPAEGKPIAVIPSIGVAGMQQTWIEDIRSWFSPDPDDDGVSLLLSTIRELPARFGRIGLPLGAESHLRMPARDYRRLEAALSELELVDCAGLMLKLCSVKSAAEIAKIRYICELASDSFNALPEFARKGQTEREVVCAMRIDLLQRGADHTPYIVSASGQDGYGDIIMGPSDRRLEDGDLLIIDTGSVFDGYFCDFDRNFAFGFASDQAKRVYETIFRSTEAGLAAARPGATTHDVWRAMWSVLEAGGATGNDVGRMGHGLGAQLTEWPSLAANDHNPLVPGMVITLEPGMNYDGDRLMVHEENIVITDSGAELLTVRAAAELPVVD